MTQQLQEPIQFGKYTLYERIGRGGMADVFKGRIQGPSGFERVFVVKRILPNLSDDPAFIRMFVEEAKLSARLNHPNIVQIFELGSVEGELFISMENVQGHDLAETMRALWKSWGAPGPDLVAYIGREMCRALSYAHGLTDDSGQLLGMIHRDVSPSNVMLSFEGAVKLLDFGIAKALGDTPEVTNNGTLKGKYAYMAPEQIEGGAVDHRIDIFAAGIVLHEVLTGRRLFKGQTDLQTMERVRRCEVPPPSQLNPACPAALDQILLRALARDPSDRFQTAGEMADALEEVVHAAHFTPQHMATILRETFGTDGSSLGPAVGQSSVGDRRFASSTNNPSLSTVSTVTSSPGRSTTVPPVVISTKRPSSPMSVAEGLGASGVGGNEGSVIPSPLPLLRPLWKRGSVWAVALLCAGGIGLAVVKGGPFPGQLAGRRATGTPSAPLPLAGHAGGEAPARARKLHYVPVLIQSEPEGADIYVAGKLESVGTTPHWVSLAVDPNTPVRVMVRKAGFQDKAIAVESEKPPTVHLIPTSVAVTGRPDRPKAKIKVKVKEAGAPHSMEPQVDDTKPKAAWDDKPLSDTALSNRKPVDNLDPGGDMQVDLQTN